ncbi:cytochrome P450 [Pilobolus umbonatus]|nr:cytochrome P450 [Pilobolus umbonatus]
MSHVSRMMLRLQAGAHHLWILLPHQVKKNAGVVTISTAVIITLVYSIITRISKPPSNLKHIPHLPYTDFVKGITGNVLFETFTKEKLVPLMKMSNGIYLQPSLAGWCVQIANPIAARKVLLGRESSYPKTQTLVFHDRSLITKFLGKQNIVFSSNNEWREQRKMANPAFQRSLPIKKFGYLTNKMIDHMDKRETDTFEVLDLFARLTLDTLGITSFGFDFNSLGEDENEWVNTYNTIKDNMLHPIFAMFPVLETTLLGLFKGRKNVHEKLQVFLTKLDAIIDEKKQFIRESKMLPDEDKDLLTLMIESAESGDSINNEELRNNLCIFFVAGHETTAYTLAFTIYELARNKDLQERAREEAFRVLGDAADNNVPTLEELKEFPYITQIMKETMRRHPPINRSTGRRILEDIELAGNVIPKGAEVIIDIYNIHHNPDIWEDPHTFNPDRFNAGGEADKQKGLAWLPFSNGARQCIGMAYSTAQQKVVLSMLLRKYRWSLPDNSPHKDCLQKTGIAFNLIRMKDKLDICFQRLD